MANARAHISRGLLAAAIAAIFAAGSLLLAGALASVADANGVHHGAKHHRALRHHKRSCTRRRRHAHHAQCAKAARRKHRPTHRRPTLHASSPTPATRATVAVPSGPCPDTELAPTASNLPQVQAATLCLINKIRLQAGETPLTDNASLDDAAQEHSDDMIARNYFDHTTPSGEAFGTRIDSAGYVPSGWSYEFGENIECGTLTLATPAAAVNGWMNSPEHRANILNEEFRDSGIGVAPAVPAQYSYGQPGATYTQDFGVTVSS
jgi:uncharacterized protein YkwD